VQLITEWLSSGWSILLVILGLGLIIFLHELGHFLMAKKNGVRVEIFSLGFGQAIFKFRRGETEYRIAWLPLGGYVKMAGETLMDERKGEPFELTSKTPWQRFQIFVAGALMNLIIAFPIAMFSFVIGKCETPNEVGRPGKAEAMAGIEQGDIIEEVDGRRIDSLDKLRIEMIRKSNGTKVPVKVRRGSEIKEFFVESSRSSDHSTAPPALALGEPTPGKPLYEQGVRGKDELVKINGVAYFFSDKAEPKLRELGGQDVTLDVRRRGLTSDKDETRTITIKIPKRTVYQIPEDENLVEARVADTIEGTPSHGVLQANDLIVKINDQPIKSWVEMKSVIEGSGGKPVQITVERGGETKTVSITPMTIEKKGMLGIAPKLNGSNIFANVKPGSYFERMGVESGDRLVSVDGSGGDVSLRGNPKKNVPQLLGLREDKERSLRIVVDRKGAQKELYFKLEAKEEGDLAEAGFKTEQGNLVTFDSRPFRRRPFGEALKAGLIEPVDITVMTVDILKKVLRAQESARGFSGPLGIAQASYHFANELSFGNFVWLLCLITVNLGIFNLLPIPILDGGHNVLLLIEVVRKWFGKPPPSEKFIAAFQYVGLAFILTLFVFVTFNDISRLISSRG
jgi:regulator of sigma E protease